MKKHILLFLLFQCAGAAWAGDEFSAVRCGADIPKVLMGKSAKKEKVRLTESRHKDIGLQNLGGDEVSDRIFVSTWRICGKEYFLLHQRGIIRDVLLFPEHNKDTPAFGGYCSVDGRDVPEYIYGVAENKGGMEASVRAAWKVDEKRSKFVEMPLAGLRCPGSEIFSVDR